MADVIETCTWIGNSPGLRPMCCNKVVAGRSYCEEHLWQVYNKGTALRKRHKDIKRANAAWDLESAFNEAVQELVDEGMDLGVDELKV